MSDAVEKVGFPPSTTSGPRRRWSEADKRRIVAESYQPGTSVALVARRNAVNANLVFNWRRQYRERGGFVPQRKAVAMHFRSRTGSGPARSLPRPDLGATRRFRFRKVSRADGARFRRCCG